VCEAWSEAWSSPMTLMDKPNAFVTSSNDHQMRRVNHLFRLAGFNHDLATTQHGGGRQAHNPTIASLICEESEGTERNGKQRERKGKERIEGKRKERKERKGKGTERNGKENVFLNLKRTGRRRWRCG